MGPLGRNVHKSRNICNVPVPLIDDRRGLILYDRCPSGEYE